MTLKEHLFAKLLGGIPYMFWRLYHINKTKEQAFLSSWNIKHKFNPQQLNFIQLCLVYFNCSYLLILHQLWILSNAVFSQIHAQTLFMSQITDNQLILRKMCKRNVLVKKIYEAYICKRCITLRLRFLSHEVSVLPALGLFTRHHVPW